MTTTAAAANTVQNNMVKQSVANETQNSMEIDLAKLFYRILDKFYLVVIAAVICGVALGYYAKTNSRVMYRSTAYAFLAQNVDGYQSLGIVDMNMGDLMKEDYIAAFSNRHVHETVIKKLGLPYLPEQMNGMISATYSEESHLIRVTSNSTDPEEAINLANAYVEAASYFFSSVMVNDIAGIWENAVRSTPYETMPLMTYLVYGVLIGLVLSVGLIVVCGVLDDRIRVPEEIEKPFGLPVLGVITKQKKSREGESIPISINDREDPGPYAHFGKLNRPSQSGLDMVNTIGANLHFSIRHKNVFAVASCKPGDGKTYTTVQLGLSLAEGGKRVVILDGDFRESALRKQYAIRKNNAARSLEEYLCGKCDLDDCICSTSQENLSIVLCDSGCVNPIPMINSDAFSELIQVLSEEYDLVLIDTTDIGRSADAVRIINYCDGVILVANYGRTKQRQMRDILRKIEIARCEVVGAVINRVKFDTLLSKKSYWVLRGKR